MPLRWSIRLLATLLASLLSGCASMGYYWQSATGHLGMMQAARPLDQWLDDAGTHERLREQLRLAARIRAFAVSELHLPENASYLRYADLGRPAAVWNVVAAPELSLQPQRWCFLVAGCVSYKGYYKESEAIALAARLQAQGLDTAVLPVPAYSTLGWLNWAGGDPLLSTFIAYPEGALASLIFHELAHQVVYVSGDTAFNESFATTVERLGTQRWLAQASPEARLAHEAREQSRQRWRQLALALRQELAQIYGEDGPRAAAPGSQGAAASGPPRTSAEQQRLRERKQAAFERFRHRHAQLRHEGALPASLDRWVASSNNATLAVLADYEDWTPAFEQLFRQSGQWPRFYAEVRRLARLPSEQRHAALLALSALGAGAGPP